MRARVVSALPPALQRLVERIAGPGVRARMARGAFWSVTSTGVNRVLALVVSIVVARVLGKERYGGLSVIQSTVGMFGLVAGLGTSLTVTKYVAEFRHRDPVRAGRIVALTRTTAMISSACVALLVAALAPWLARRVLANESLAPYVRLGCGILFFEAWNGTAQGALTGLEAFRTIARIDVIAGLCGVLATALGVVTLGIEGALLGMILGLAAHAVGYTWALRHHAREAGFPLTLERASTEWRLLLGFSLPALLGTAAAALVNWLARVILVNQQEGYAQMGLFHAAAQWRTAILLIPTTIAHAFLPMLANMVGNGDEAGYRKVMREGVLVSLAVALLAAIPICLGSGLIMRTYGSSFASGRAVLILLAAASMLSAAVTVMGYAIVSSDRMWLAFGLNALWGAALIWSTWAWRARGAYGFAMANVFAYAVHLVTVWGAYRDTARRTFAKEPPQP